MDAGALYDPVVTQAVFFREVGVGDSLLGNVKPGGVNIHCA